MIDLHCHLIPGVDDGPRTMADALELARLSVSDNITVAVATPHLIPRIAAKAWPTIRAAHAELVNALKEQQIPLVVHLAAEVRISAELLNLVSRTQLPVLGYLNGRPVHLLEFPHTDLLPVGSEQLMTWLIQQQRIPLLAHPERHSVFQRHPDRLETFIQRGCLLQVTAGSLMGQFGRAARKLAFELLDKSAITILASDAHNAGDRRPNLTAAYAAVSNRIGESTARHLLKDMPAQLIGMGHFPVKAES